MFTRSSSAWLLSMSAALLLFAGCGLNTHGTGNGGGGGGPTIPCNVDSQCDDDNPCTIEHCGADKTCAFTIVDGKPAPDAAQTAGDCKTIQCKNGEPTDVAQNDDVPDDKKPCTIDSCANMVASHVPKPTNTVCVDEGGNAGRCDMQGECSVVCTESSQCATTNPCVVPSCDVSQNKCVYVPLPDGMDTPNVTQVKGDCHQRICLGGEDVDQIDDSDVPLTTTDCDTEVCNNGVKSNPPKALDNPCSTFNGSQPGFCDGAGTCQQCAVDNECPGTIDDCQRPACVNFACGTEFDPVGTLAADHQTQFDCHKVVCDGSGGRTTLVDDTDLPNDNNACTQDTCTNGTKANVTLVDGTGCGMSQACLTGQCTGCTNNNQCTSPNTCGGGGAPNVCGCTPKTCAQLGKTCGTVSDGCVGTLNCNDSTKNGTETDVDCGGTTCGNKCGNGKTCSAGSDCTSGFCVDGVCCNSACTGTCQACTAALKGSGPDGTCGAIATGTDPNNECQDQGQTSCGNDGFCDGAGACRKYTSGTVCTAASCASSSTLTKAKTCNGTGGCVAPSTPTQACSPYVCASNACLAMCGSDTDCASGNYCSNGTCVTKLANGGTCTAANQCTSGFCVDGVCCNTSCTGACQACSAAKKQSGNGAGTCGNAKNNQADPRGICTATPPCGQTGMCSAGACEVTAMGTVCQAASCTGNQQTTAKTCDGSGSCNQGGATTACTGNLKCDAAMASCLSSCGTDDTKCVAGNYCDAGTCKPTIADGGMGCTGGSACVSGFCGSNNVCCTALCSAQTTCTTGTNTLVSTLTTCNATGACNSTSMTCPNSLMCNAAGTACLTACGNANATGDARCVDTAYCDGVSGGDCQPKKAKDASCGRPAECTSGLCTMGNCE
ncbi:Tryptophan synthase alpha chain [Minicystis rosea]|nr:Tryptophan synthase alpha chain [Minicystis rosea]